MAKRVMDPITTIKDKEISSSKNIRAKPLTWVNENTGGINL